MSNTSILSVYDLDFHWKTEDPFLFCANHDDLYPSGNEELGPNASLSERNMGADFTIRDGWRMYHGIRIPGFPAHPHRGFETVTIVLEGLVDHFDSMGAKGRYGAGDIQWMTAGSGIQHSEMFPLVNTSEQNPLKLFQIWLNLPSAKKLSPPTYKMLWSEQLPIINEKDINNRSIKISLIAGRYNNIPALSPPENSWAAEPENAVRIMLIKLEAGAVWNLSQAGSQINTNLYFYKGTSISIQGKRVNAMSGIKLNSSVNTEITNGISDSHFILLQGKPIGEPVAQYGPFVMNTMDEITQAVTDYRHTHFGGWPWKEEDPVHERTAGRIARYPDGSTEMP